MIVFVVCSSLKDVTIDAVSALSNSSNTLKTVEKCSCPRGYQGLSCEVRTQQVLVSRNWSMYSRDLKDFERDDDFFLSCVSLDTVELGTSCTEECVCPVIVTTTLNAVTSIPGSVL